MAAANTTFLRLYKDGSTIDCEVDSSVDLTRELKETVCKDEPNGTVTLGKISATMQITGLLKTDSADGMDLASDLVNGTEVDAMWSSTENASISVQFQAYITSWSGQSSGVGEAGQFSATLTKSQGDVTVG